MTTGWVGPQWSPPPVIYTRASISPSEYAGLDAYRKSDGMSLTLDYKNTVLLSWILSLCQITCPMKRPSWWEDKVSHQLRDWKWLPLNPLPVKTSDETWPHFMAWMQPHEILRQRSSTKLFLDSWLKKKKKTQNQTAFGCLLCYFRLLHFGVNFFYNRWTIQTVLKIQVLSTVSWTEERWRKFYAKWSSQ